MASTVHSVTQPSTDWLSAVCRDVPDDGQAVLYHHWGIHYDEDGAPHTVLYYVGFSEHFKKRQRSHRAQAPWWGSIHRIAVRRYPTAVEALAMESLCIATDNPLFNIAGSVR